MPATNIPIWNGAALVGLFVSLAFPLVGITPIAVLAHDVLVFSRLPTLKPAVS